MKLHFVPAPAGSGKTHKFSELSVKYASAGKKVLIIQPTLKLIDSTYRDEICPINVDNIPVTRIHGDVVSGSTVSALQSHFDNAVPGQGDIVLCTHSAFLRAPFLAKKWEWIVFVDEAIEPVIYEQHNVPETHALLTGHLRSEADVPPYAKLNAFDPKAVKAIAENAQDDELWQPFEGLCKRVLDKRWEVFVLEDQYERLRRGGGTDFRSRQLITYSVLSADIFAGFRWVCIGSANFTDSVLYRLWSHKINFVEAKSITRQLRYSAHANGARLHVWYCFDCLNSRKLHRTELGDGTTVLDAAVDATKAFFGADPFVWMGNADMSDMALGHGQRLPNSPHGLNNFMGYDNVAVFSALNPHSPHIAFLKLHGGMESAEVGDAIYRANVYQALMRCSIRDPNQRSRVRCVVMDKQTAEWLAGLFPGAQVDPLPGLGTLPTRKANGRPKTQNSVTSAERSKNTRAQKLGEWQNAIDELRASFGDKNFRDENNISTYTFSPAEISHPIFVGVRAEQPIDHLDYVSADHFIDDLKHWHSNTYERKDDAPLIAPANFSTGRRLDDVQYVNGIWLDIENGHLRPNEFSDMFPHLRVAIWNTWSAAASANRYRVFIPTSIPMPAAVQTAILRHLILVLNSKGFWGKEHPKRKQHGIDMSKLNAASIFYMPSQSGIEPECSFFLDAHKETGAELDVIKWLEEAIKQYEPEPEPFAISRPEPKAIITGKTAALRSLQQALIEQHDRARKQSRQATIDRAVQKWRLTAPHEGNSNFYKLGLALRSAGCEESEIRTILRTECYNSGSNGGDRKAQINSIISSLRRLGTVPRPRW